MSPRRRCWSGPVDAAALDQALAQVVLAQGDVAAIREFRDYLASTAQQRALNAPATTTPATDPTTTRKAAMSKPVQTRPGPRPPPLTELAPTGQGPP